MRIHFDELESKNIFTNNNLDYVSTRKLLEFLKFYLKKINWKHINDSLVDYHKNENKYVNRICNNFLEFVLSHKLNKNQLKVLLRRYIVVLKNKLEYINSNYENNEVKIITRSVSKNILCNN